MNDYKELIGDIGDCLIAQPSEAVCKRILREAADAIEQLVKERDAAIADLKINWLCAVCKNRVVTKEWMACKNKDFYEAPCGAPTCLNFEWRGVQEVEHG